MSETWNGYESTTSTGGRVQRGAVTFETDAVVEPGEAIRFAPGEFQRGVNEGDRVAAPREAGETEIRRQCDVRGERARHTVERVDDGRPWRAVWTVTPSPAGSSSSAPERFR